ncbi:methyl jasmonate esterase 1-like [Euphorbia lathyris]|uniref:methyl jasmonate esterase 1-like n=1 Tax=Euphorbia lathyris TaxID=212925 RepID=UPI003313D7A3
MQSGGGQRHFVLIHGACHGAWCWYKVSPRLKSAGHKVSALDMAASGVNLKKLEELRSFSDFYEPLLEFMENLPEEERVILVAHSMCGYGISIAMEKFPEKISAAVFVAAGMPGSDLSYKSIDAKYAERFKIYSETEDPQFIFGNGPDNPPTATLLGPKQMASRLYRLSPPEDLELGKLLVRPVPIYNNTEANDEIMVFTKERHGSVLRFFIICDEENCEEQKWMVENNPPHEFKLISDSDHMVMFSKPQELASYFLEIGDKYF